MNNGYLISFIGIDGSGKTTQAKILVDSLNKHGFNASYVWCRWEPFLLRYFISRWRIRSKKKITKKNALNAGLKSRKQKLLNNVIIRWLWILLFLIEYSLQIFSRIRIKLLKGQLVVSDRIFYDSIIDQAVNLEQRKRLLLDNLDTFWMRIAFPVPDLVIYVDCPENIALSRTDDDLDIEYLRDRRKLYLSLAERYGWYKVNGSLPVEEVANHVKKILYKKLAIIF